mgnify:CR=1 FL=1
MIASVAISEVEAAKIQAYLIIAIGVLTVLTAFLRVAANNKNMHNQSLIQRIIFEGELVVLLFIGGVAICFGIELLQHNSQGRGMSAFTLLAEYLKGANPIGIAGMLIFVPLLTACINMPFHNEIDNQHDHQSHDANETSTNHMLQR